MLLSHTFRDGYDWSHLLGQQNLEEGNGTVLPCSDTKGGRLQKTCGPGTKQSATYRVLQVPTTGDATQVCICLILLSFKGILVIKTVENRMNIFSLNDLFVLCKTELLGLNKTVYKYIYIYIYSYNWNDCLCYVKR